MRIIVDNAITDLVGEEVVPEGTGTRLWWATVAGINGSLYGIPANARRVGKFNPIDKSMTHIGPDFGEGKKWCKGAMADNGIIYCAPWDEDRGILKIDTNTDTATELDRNLIPQRGIDMWVSCALALDGCIYFMPYEAHHIMKLDPNNGDAMSSVGDDLGDAGCWKYSGTVVGIDGCVYGIPDGADHILKYDPINGITSIFGGEQADDSFYCFDGALGRDGCIYALSSRVSRVLKIDTANNYHCFVGSSIQSYHIGIEWYDPILGIDGCIYWPPNDARRTLKYDPHSNQASLVGDDFGRRQDMKWVGRWQLMELSTASQHVSGRFLPLTHGENSRSQQRQIWRNTQRNLDSSFESMIMVLILILILILIQPQSAHILIAQLRSLVCKQCLKKCKSICLLLMNCVLFAVYTRL